MGEIVGCHASLTNECRTCVFHSRKPHIWFAEPGEIRCNDGSEGISSRQVKSAVKQALCLLGLAACSSSDSGERSVPCLEGKLRARSDAGRPARGHGLELGVEAHAFHAVDAVIAEDRGL